MIFGQPVPEYRTAKANNSQGVTIDLFCGKHGITDLTNIFNGYQADKWDREIAEDKLENNTLTYTFYYKTKLAPNGEATLFESVTIPSVFDVDDMSKLATFQLKITGEAIQAANTGDTAQKAFEKFN